MTDAICLGALLLRSGIAVAADVGDPNGKGLPAWPAFDPKADLVMGFGDKVEVVPLPHKRTGFLGNLLREPQEVPPTRIRPVGQLLIRCGHLPGWK